MFDNIGGWEILVLFLVGLFIFGPDKLPQLISDGVGMLRKLRDMARGATSELSRELGTDVQLEDLNPKAFLRKHVLSEDDERAIRRPLDELVSGMRGDLKATKAELDRVAGGVRGELNGTKADIKGSVQGMGRTSSAAAPAASVPEPAADRYDDAT